MLLDGIFIRSACGLLILLTMFAPAACLAQGTTFRRVDTARQLVDALNDESVSEISVASGTYNLAPVVPASAESAAVIDRSLSMTTAPGAEVLLVGGGEGSNFRLLEIRGSGGGTDVLIDGIAAENFSVDGDGGLFLVGDGSAPVTFQITNSSLSDNSATGDGGAIATREQAIANIKNLAMEIHNATVGGALHLLGSATIANSEFRANVASGDRGGAIFAAGPRFTLLNSRLRDNRVSGSGDAGAVTIEGETIAVIRGNVFLNNQDNFNSANDLSFTGMAIDACLIYKSLGCISALVDGNTFVRRPGNIGDVSVRQRGGTMVLRNNTFKNIPDNGSALIYSSGRLTDGGVLMQGNLIDIDNFSPDGKKDLCRDFAGVGLVQSDGYNISEDDTCMLDGPGDRPSTDPQLETETNDGVVSLKPGSPAIDGALAAALSGDSDCSYRDVRGLGRPQDGNGDGVFECDAGAWELQGGPDIGPAHSAAYFDTGRNGEGVFVEILEGGLAFVAMFTYASDGQGLVWFVGLGNVVGNSVVVDEVLQTSGGVFGAGFNPAAVERTDVGGLALVFSSCQSTDSPGRLNFEAEINGPFEGLVSVAGRLSTIVDCSLTPGAAAGRSGSFFDPARDGEGVFVQWLSNGQVVVIWYTYSPDGDQFWTISADATVSGNTVTANMLYPATTTSFGSGFDPAEISLQNWGTLTLTYTGCDSVAFSWDSVVPGFGQGSYDYSRLTSLSGTNCDL